MDTIKNQCTVTLPRVLVLGLRIPILAAILWCSSALAQSDPSVVGRWSPVRSWPGPTVHEFLLPTGKVMFFPGNGINRGWDPVTNQFLKLARPDYNIDCSGHAFLTDGRLLVAGGDRAGLGLPYAEIYNPFTDSWTPLPNMNAGRYYPTVITLANRDALVVSGATEVQTQTSLPLNPLPQVWQRLLGSWRDLTGAKLAIYWYPFCFVAPNGKVFFAGPDLLSRYLDTAGVGAWTPVAKTIAAPRVGGSAVMYDDGRVLMVGGDNPPTPTAEVIDLNSLAPSWRYMGSMSVPRRLLNATIIPDGKVLVTGGTSAFGIDNPAAPALAAESWDPNTESWTTLASSAVYRGNHSTALLLPDGRVLSTSGDFSPRTAEVFSPPYLFRGPRPTLTSAPGSVNYNQFFFVGTPNASTITKVTWVRLSAVTHGFNMNQRINHLVFWQVAGGLMVRAPVNGALCTPGHYMLFILNSNGVPSVARILQIR